MTDRPRRRRTARITLFGAVIAAILGTGACSTLNDVQSPRSAREAAAAKSGHQPGGGVQFANCAVQKCIALTFDGGRARPRRSSWTSSRRSTCTSPEQPLDAEGAAMIA
jgi:hypothetical protein